MFHKRSKPIIERNEQIMAEKTIPVTQNEQSSLSQETTRSSIRYATPPVDIYEELDRLVVVADLPGAERDTVKVNLENGTLTMEAATQPASMANPIYREFEMVNFYRQFELSEWVDSNKITAELKNGVLNLNLPKAEKAKPKPIAVKIS